MTTLTKPARFLGPEFPAYDIVAAANDIEKCTAALTFHDFVSNKMLQSATQRLLGIIADNAVRLGVRDNRDWKELTGIIHHRFEMLTPQLTWDVIQLDLPRLKKLVQAPPK